jgi:hypothetical protein
MLEAATNSYPETMTLAEARSLFFARTGLGADGGYGARWVRIEMKPFPVYFPNSASRVRSAKLHDLHHLALEYKTDWPGEVEIAGWEMASGCGRHPWAWLLNLGAFAVGIVLFPKRLYRAFVRGRHAANLYREGFPEMELGNKTVGWLRRRLRIDGAVPEASASDKIAFARWCFIAIGYHAIYAVAGVAILWWIVRRLL